jgi:hypothetical protein
MMDNASVLPRAAMQWILQHSVASNVELARLTNVCRAWRMQVEAVLLETIIQDDTDDDDTNTNNTTNHVPSRLGSLLLPCMLQHQQRQLSASFSSSTSGSYSSAHTTTINNTIAEETFCAAWFPPSGIQVVRVPLVASNNSNWNDTTENNQQQQQQRQSTATTITAASTRTVSQQLPTVPCVLEWKGYQDAADVLLDFGYAPVFVRQVLARASAAAAAAVNNNNGSNSNTTNTINNATTTTTSKPLSKTQTTIAVRGATIARPDQYCLCRDTCSDPDDDEDELRRELLPRALARAVQFLNADGSHAVCMTTPKFDGFVKMPITICLVGIATEDGCFVSGLERRVELGHGMVHSSPTSIASSDDLSPVCLVTECYGHDDDDAMLEDASSPTHAIHNGDDDNSTCSDSDDSNNHDAQSCDCAYRNVRSKVDSLQRPDTTPTSTMNNNNYNNNHVTTAAAAADCLAPTTKSVYQGQLGPGQWHCYVAVYDGTKSEIRIDGIREPITASSENSVDDNNNRTTVRLDGLTIGSDHTWDMSLCSGYGSGGEGQGAIAELAVFQGRLDACDIEQLEAQMMNRHDIARVDAKSRSEQWHEYKWARQAQALLDGQTGRVPLRILANHKSVAWKMQNHVTGKSIPIQKIGCRQSGEDSSTSEW